MLELNDKGNTEEKLRKKHLIKKRIENKMKSRYDENY